jgi:hypothetical protein
MSSISKITREACTSFTNTIENAYQNIQKQASRFYHIAKENPKSAMGLAAAAIAALSGALILQWALSSEVSSRKDLPTDELDNDLVQNEQCLLFSEDYNIFINLFSKDYNIFINSGIFSRKFLVIQTIFNAYLSNAGKETLAQ